jgi:hypothetical protein
MTKNNEEKAINFLFDCKKCKLKSEEECLIYERCYKANEYICNLNKNLKVKEQECEELKEKVKKYGEINEQETKDYAELWKQHDQLKQTLSEIKEFCIDHTQLIHDAYPYLNIILEKINEVEDE